MSDAAPAAALVPWPRAWLFTPAHDARKLAAADGSGAEALIADLEDAVPGDDKDAAREAAVRFVATRGGAPRVVRINDPRTPHGRRDIEALSPERPVAVMVPKAELASLAQVHEADLPTIALLETARGVSEAEQVAVLPGVLALAIGTLDLAAELGLGEMGEGLELLHVRSRIVLAAALGSIPAIDGPHVQPADREGLRAESRRARALGFAGKLCIHPGQLQVVSDALAPAAVELERARAVLAAYERGLAERRGAVLDGGEMIDLASVRRARRTLGLG